MQFVTELALAFFVTEKIKTTVDNCRQNVNLIQHKPRLFSSHYLQRRRPVFPWRVLLQDNE